MPYLTLRRKEIENWRGKWKNILGENIYVTIINDYIIFHVRKLFYSGSVSILCSLQVAQLFLVWPTSRRISLSLVRVDIICIRSDPKWDTKFSPLFYPFNTVQRPNKDQMIPIHISKCSTDIIRDCIFDCFFLCFDAIRHTFVCVPTYTT